MKAEIVTRTAGEILILVVGILIALGVDASWQARENRSLAREAAAGVARSFVDNRTTLESAMGRRAKKLAATEQLLLLATDQVQDISPDSVAELLHKLLSAPNFDADDSRIRELVASGRFNLIRDDELRHRLAAWEVQYRDLSDMEDLARSLIFEDLHPWLRTRIPVTFGQAQPDIPPRSLNESDVAHLRGVELENLLRAVHFIERRVQARTETMLGSIEELLRLLAVEAGQVDRL